MSVRGAWRWGAGALLIVAIALLSACRPQGPSFTVNVGTDGRDARIGDGVCEVTLGAGNCSLRAAIDEANANPDDANTIVLETDAALSLTAIDDSNASGDLDIRTDMTIRGQGRTVDGRSVGRVIQLHTGSLTLDRVTITGGATTGNGGGILQESGSVSLVDSRIRGNRSTATSGSGAGVHQTAGTMVVLRSTIDGNTAPLGAGITSNGTLLVSQSTVAGNSGGAIRSAGTTTVRGSTIIGSTGTAGAGLHRIGGTLNVGGSIIGGPRADCAGLITSVGFNIDSDGTCLLTDPTDRPATNSQLAPLADNGGGTPTALPHASSPARDAIPVGTAGLCDSTTLIDQRGQARPGGTACDIGAVEGNGPLSFTPLALVVDTSQDAPDTNPGDGSCTTSTGDCSLRAAITEANQAPTADTIAIAAGIDPVLAILGAGSDTNATGDLDITDSLTLHGAGATIDARGIDRVVDVLDGAVQIDHVALTGGSTTSGGGGIQQVAGRLQVDSTTVHGNTGTTGGGILGNGILLVERSTVADNAGSGIRTNGSATIRSSTIVGSTATTGAGLHRAGGTLTVRASIISGHGADCTGMITSAGYNLDTDATCGLTQATDLPARSALLGPLRDNGGATPTVLPHVGSPALDAMAIGAPGLCDAGVPADQRGMPRPVGPGCDIGATEGHDPTALTPLDLIVGTSVDAPDQHPGDGTCATAGGACSLRAAITEANAALTVDTITIAAGTNPQMSIAGADDTNAAGDLDVTDDLVIHGGGATIDAGGIDRALDLRDGSLRMDTVTVTGGTTTNGGGGIRQQTGQLFVTAATIRGNSTSGNGGGILSSSGSLEVVESVIEANTGAGGGGIYSVGTLDVTRTIVRGNTSSGPGGGIQAVGPTAVDASTFEGNTVVGPGAGGGLFASTVSGAPLEIQRSTFTGNVAGSGGGIASQARTVLERTTIVGNSATDGPSAYWGAGPLEFSGTIFAGTGRDCAMVGAVTYVSGGHNIDTDDTCELHHATDRPTTNPLVTPLADNGGVTPTMLLYANSSALDAIPIGTPGLCDGTSPTDQRDVARPAGPACDIGATEGNDPATVTALDLTVDTAADDVDADAGDGICATAAGTCSLRAAVTETNAAPTVDTITIAAGIDPALTRAGAADGANDTGDLDITDSLTIHGGGATIDANGLDRAIDMRDGILRIDHLTITGGVAPTNGGAIRTAVADLELDQVVLTGNAAPNGVGGAIQAERIVVLTGSTLSSNEATVAGGMSVRTLTMDRSTVVDNHATGEAGGARVSSGVIERSVFEGNSAGADGGGLMLVGTQSTVAATTVVGNHAGGGGGGIAVLSVSVNATLIDVTIDRNVAVGAGGGIRSRGFTSITSSSISENQASSGNQVAWAANSLTIRSSALVGSGNDCVGTIASAGYNISSDASCALVQATDRPGTDPLLLPLDLNGGPTPTRLPEVNSPALDAIPTGTAVLCDGTAATDQRGIVRPQGAGCDIGAVEGSDPTEGGPLDLQVDDAGDSPEPVPATPGTADDLERTGDLDVPGDLTIVGQGATVDAAGLVIDVDRMPGALADDGGLTRTRLPRPGSPPRDGNPVGTAGRCGATTPLDQRGMQPPNGAACDLGATER